MTFHHQPARKGQPHQENKASFLKEHRCYDFPLRVSLLNIFQIGNANEHIEFTHSFIHSIDTKINQ